MACNNKLQPSALYFVIALAIFTIFNFISISRASDMPSYERLQPITANLDAPRSVALDNSENIYVAEPGNDRVVIYSQSGSYLRTLSGLDTPISVSVDGNGRIIVGNRDSGNVEVYGSDLTLLFKLGTGDGEFSQPGGIATDSAGNIYVADSREDSVKVYSSEGVYRFSFGSSGDGDGEFHFPTSIAVNNKAAEIIVSDLQIIEEASSVWPIPSPGEGARIQVFDMNGVFKRGFGEFGLGEGKLFRPTGVAVDEEGRIYVTDSYQNVVQVFGSDGTSLGTIYDLDNPMRTPLGVAAGSSNRLFITSFNASRVDVYGVGVYTHMEVSPSSLTFEGQEGGSNPALQNVEIKNNGAETLNWTVSTDDSWIILSESSGSTVSSGTSTISVGVNLTGLSSGTYTGSVQITAESGAAEVVNISLTVLSPAELSISPSSLEFISEQGSIPSSQVLSITNLGEGALTWTASADSGWILLEKDSGTAPDTVEVSVDISLMQEGVHTGSITITADDGAIGSPATIPVTLNIMVLTGTINVNTNLQAATFAINGPESFSGSGTSWSAAEALIGTYTIVFGEVEGYVKPSSQTQTLQADEVITFTGEYEAESPGGGGSDRDSIIVGAGPGSRNSGLVKVLNSDGSETGVEFNAHGYKYGVNVASGDIDGDGVFEIITGAGEGASNPAEINVYDRKGNKLTGMSITAYEYSYGVNVASGDFDGDGKYEIITGPGAGASNPAEVKVFVYDASTGGLRDSGINLIAYATGYGVKVAAGDVDGDGVDEIITVPGPGGSNYGIIKIWEVETSLGIGQWSTSAKNEFTVTSRYNYSVNIASGDIDGDGRDEIITGAGPHRKESDVIKVFDQDGALISEFRAKIVRRYGANVAGGDIDGDGVDEIIVGAGAGKRNRAIVKIFDVNGIEKRRFKALKTRYGVNVAAGDLGY